MRIRKPDLQKAISFRIAAEKEMNYLKSLPISDEGRSTLIKGICETFRIRHKISYEEYWPFSIDINTTATLLTKEEKRGEGL